MSKKNLLNEATIRRFMKLANMEPLTSPFVDRLDEMAYGDDESMEEMYHGDKAARDDDMDADMDMEADMDMDADMDMPAEEEAGEAEVEEEVEDIVGQMVRALQDVLAQNDMEEVLDVEEEEEAEMEPAPEMDDEEAPEADMDAEMDMEAEEDVLEETTEEITEETVEEASEEALEEVQVVDDEALINEVAKRVTARLVKAMAKK
jgi:CCR4-NOT transcription complex subunit 1